MKKTTKKNNMSRRNFITLAGGATAGFAAISALGMSSLDWAINHHEIDIESLGVDKISTDVLVIGSGMAGLFAVVKAHDAGANVLMVSKGRLGASVQTPFAKGIFAFDAEKEDLNLDEFVAKVSRSALGTNNNAYTRQMAEHSLARVNELKEWGFFDSSLYNKSFRKPIEDRNIEVQERIVITHLIKENNKISIVDVKTIMNSKYNIDLTLNKRKTNWHLVFEKDNENFYIKQQALDYYNLMREQLHILK